MDIPAPSSPFVAYRDRLSDGADRAVYFAVWIAGTVAIVGLKTFHFPQWIVTFVPVALMLGYTAYLWFAPRERSADDRAGDSLYYLGFLYTMTSLAYSLYEFGQSSGDGQSSADTGSIITNFGVALSTTIVGMAVRVMFHQMRENPLELEREARIDIAAGVSRLRTELLSAIEDFGILRRAAIQNTAETLQEVTKETYEKLSAGATRHEQFTVELLRVVQETADAMKQHTALTSRAAKRTVEALDKLTDRLESTDLPADMLKTKFAELASSFSEVANHELARAEAQRRSFESLEQTVTALQTTTTGVNGQVSGLIQIIREERDAMRIAINGVVSATGAMQEGITAIVTTSQSAVTDERSVLRQLTSDVDEQLAFVRQHRKALEGEVETSRKATASVHSSLTSLVNLVSKQVDGR